MKESEIRRLEMFIRVRQFGVAHAASFTEGSRGRELFAELDTVVAELETHSTAQASGKSATREHTTLKSVAKESLQHSLTALSHTARSMALTTPGLEDKFRLPRSASDQAWLALARSFAQDAAPLKDEFVRWGLHPNFLDGLNSEIAAFAQSIESRAQKTGERVAATASIDGAIERGTNAARALDAVVHNTFREDAGTLAEWTSASHVERQPHRASTPETPPQHTPA
jgi:hypothetical protein